MFWYWDFVILSWHQYYADFRSRRRRAALPSCVRRDIRCVLLWWLMNVCVIVSAFCLLWCGVVALTKYDAHSHLLLQHLDSKITFDFLIITLMSIVKVFHVEAGDRMVGLLWVLLGGSVHFLYSWFISFLSLNITNADSARGNFQWSGIIWHSCTVKEIQILCLQAFARWTMVPMLLPGNINRLVVP